MSFWLLSPFALNSLLNTYERMLSFAKDEAKYNHQGCYKHVLYGTFAYSAIADFKRWIFINNKNAIVTFEGNNNMLKYYDVNKISSISLVRAIRLFEKIKEYINKAEIENGEISVCVVGYTLIKNNRPVEMEALAEFIGQSIDNIKLNYHVILNKYKDRHKPYYIKKIINDKYDIDVKFVQYDNLFLKENIRALIMNNELIFFLDCPNLYYEEFDQHIYGSWHSMYNAMKLNNYERNYNNANLGSKLNGDGILAEAAQQLSVLSNKNAKGYGYYNPIIREYILDYIKNEVNKS